jgi:antibiotic biosynthesis monooxygenase (ABM) superfamily enzyme
MAALMTFAVYPVVTLYLYILMPLTPGWEMWQRSLILVPFMATTIVLFIVPLITRHFGAFIAGRPTAAKSA